MRKIDEYVINYAREDARLKFANEKSVIEKCLPEGGGALPQEHSVCTELLCRSGEGRVG